MKNKRNLLVTLADENYVEQAKQLFSSVYWNAGWKGDYMLLAHEIPEKKLKWFRDKGILVKKCKPILDSEDSRIGKWPPVVFSKFYLFTTEFKKWRNILFLDADIIVKASLDELTKVKRFAAVKGHGRLSKLFLKPSQIRIEKRNKGVFNKLKKEYNLKEAAFNSGLMAFNTNVIKKGAFSELKQILIRYIEISPGDDNILNLYFYKKWVKLPKIYNINPYNVIHFSNLKPKETWGAILHFHDCKPWDPKNYFYKEWKNNLDKSELINLKKIPNPRTVISKKKAKKYEEYLKKRKIRYFHKHLFWKISISIRRFIDEYTGIFGIFIERRHPKIYFKLKRLKEKLAR